MIIMQFMSQGASGPDSTYAPAKSYDLIQNYTVYVPRATYVIAVRVFPGTDMFGNAFIASVSYNGVKISTTGDTNSQWRRAVTTTNVKTLSEHCFVMTSFISYYVE